VDHIHSLLKVTIEQFSDKGPKPENQDTIGARIPEGSALTSKGIAAAIADGVSSSNAAKQASQSAVTGFLTDYYATPDTWRTQQSAVRVIQSLNRYLWGQSQNSVREEGYLTTFSSIIFKGDKCFIFHVGDTRVYRYRANALEQLTRDHTQKIDRDTRYLSRALGADSVIEIDMLAEELCAGDIFLLTTDGIHDTLSYDILRNIIKSENEPQKICDNLFKRALNNNIQDNLSAQVIRVETLGTPSKKDVVTVLSKLPFPPLMEAGNKLDEYRVEKLIDESERSQVYQVRDVDERLLVMKTPSINYEDDPAYIERFVMESWIGSRIQNPYVVRVVEPARERKLLYYLTEYVAGPSLSQLIKERAPIAIPDAVELIENIVKGLRAFHRKDTLHQDIKPDNIIVGKNGPVIIDFGSCFVAGIHEVGAPFQRDIILGTLNYSAPEYRFGGNISQKSDQFSLAVILYEMLTGKHPYGEKYESSKDLKAFQRLSYIAARKFNPLIPIWLDRCLEKALSIMPATRYSSLSEWLKDLQRPNPKWLEPRETPLLERNPVRFWQLLAAIGWCAFIALLASRHS